MNFGSRRRAEVVSAAKIEGDVRGLDRRCARAFKNAPNGSMLLLLDTDPSNLRLGA